MKSQDVVLLFKIISIASGEQAHRQFSSSPWRDWEEGNTSLIYAESDDSLPLDMRTATPEEIIAAQYSVRALSAVTGISKSQISLALARCQAVGLMTKDRATSIPRVNTTALAEFVIHGLKYVFPAKPGAIARGIATAAGAPVLSTIIASAGDQAIVWPDATGTTKGQALEPLYKTVPLVVRRDPVLYSLCALTDSIRIGGARERAAATDALNRMLNATYV